MVYMYIYTVHASEFVSQINKGVTCTAHEVMNGSTVK